MKLFLILYLSSKLSYGLTNECKEFRLDTSGGTLEHVPIHDQMADVDNYDLNICYSVVGSYLFDAYRSKKGNLNAPSSPSVLAATYSAIYKKKSNDDLALGQFRRTLEAAIKYGTCDIEAVVWNHNQIVEQYRIFDSYKKGDLVKDAAAAVVWYKSSCCSTCAKNALKDIQIYAANALDEANKAAYITKVMNKSCENHTFKLPDNWNPQIETNEVKNMKMSDKIEVLNRMIGENPDLPIAFNINYRAIGRSGVSSDHFMAFVGQRIKNGVCQILLRDTYGSESCKKNLYKKTLSCENGSIWIDRKSALEETYWLNSLHD